MPKKRRRAPARLNTPKPVDPFIEYVKSDLGALADSGFMIQTFTPEMVTDYAGSWHVLLEVGLAVMIGKPLVITAYEGDVLPPRLVGIADEIVWIDRDDFEKSQPALAAAFLRVAAKYPDVADEEQIARFRAVAEGRESVQDQ